MDVDLGGQAEDTAFVGGSQIAEGLGVDAESSLEGVFWELNHEVVVCCDGGEPRFKRT